MMYLCRMEEKEKRIAIREDWIDYSQKRYGVLKVPKKNVDAKANEKAEK